MSVRSSSLSRLADLPRRFESRQDDEEEEIKSVDSRLARYVEDIHQLELENTKLRGAKRLQETEYKLTLESVRDEAAKNENDQNEKFVQLQLFVEKLELEISEADERSLKSNQEVERLRLKIEEMASENATLVKENSDYQKNESVLVDELKKILETAKLEIDDVYKNSLNDARNRQDVAVAGSHELGRRVLNMESEGRESEMTIKMLREELEEQKKENLQKLQEKDEIIRSLTADLSQKSDEFRELLVHQIETKSELRAMKKMKGGEEDEGRHALVTIASRKSKTARNSFAIFPTSHGEDEA